MGSLVGAIEWNKIGELLYVAPIAGLLVAIAYSLMLVGWARSSELRRGGEGGGAAAAGYSVLAVLSTIVFFAVVVYGVLVIVKK
ncbi:MAG: hypothetical protein JWR63_3917 [Conexibacter sp.]|nr:hypothetical protein [Conexibacter sp.]